MDFGQLASDEAVATAKQALEANGFSVTVVNTEDEAKTTALSLIPEGSEVMTMTSITLDELGLAEIINDSGKYDSVRTKLNSMNRETQSREMQQLGASPDFTIGSVHAVTQDGHVLVASNTGSQLPAYVSGASHVIWVVSTKKVVTNDAEAHKRIYEYSLPLESERAHKAYGVPGSEVRKLMLFNSEGTPNRINIILVKQPLGF